MSAEVLSRPVLWLLRLLLLEELLLLLKLLLPLLLWLVLLGRVCGWVEGLWPSNSGTRCWKAGRSNPGGE